MIYSQMSTLDIDAGSQEESKSDCSKEEESR